MNHKVYAIQQLRSATGTHVLCLTEMWHEDSDAISIKKLHANDLQVLEHSKPIPKSAKTDCISFINHSSVDIVAPTNVKLEKVPLIYVPKSFEHLCTHITSRGASYVGVLLYRPGSQPVSTLFFEKLKVILVAKLSIPIIIVCGDTNVRLDQQEDIWTICFTDLLTSFGRKQRINHLTHDQNGILDVVITFHCSSSNIAGHLPSTKVRPLV